MKKKKGFIILGGFVILFCFICLIAILSGNQIKISSYDAIVEVDEAGNMSVVETWNIKYPSGYNVRFRDIPYNKDHRNNPLTSSLDYQNDKASFDENLVSVKVSYLDDDDYVDITDQVRIGYSFNNDRDELGNYIECEPSSSTCESLFVDLSAIGGMKANMIFEYSYTINGAVTSYNDIAELNWVLFSYSEAKVKEATVTVNIAGDNDLDSLRAYGHGLTEGNIAILNEKEVAIRAKNIGVSEELEIRILMNNTAVANINQNNVIRSDLESKIIDYEYDLAKQTQTANMVAKIINLLTAVMVILMIYITYKVYKRYDKEYEASFTGIYYRELPFEYSPAEMSYLYYFGKTNNEDVTATLLDLVRRGYLKINVVPSQKKKDDNIEISLVNGKALSDLLPHEAHVIDWFINKMGDGVKTSIEQIEVYGKKSYKEANLFEKMGQGFKEKVKNTSSTHDFFENAAQRAKSKSQGYVLIPLVLALVCLLVAPLFQVEAMLNFFICLAVIVIFEIYICTIKRRSKNGNEEFAKWKAFKNFLEEFGNMDDYPIPSIIVWEHYLVYAVSLKIADKVMDQLKVKLPELPSEDVGGTFIYNRNYPSFYYGYMYGSLNRSITTAKTNAISTIASHNSSNSSGRGGGFSGGSSFGGGGGGGRSR